MNPMYVAAQARIEDSVDSDLHIPTYVGGCASNPVVWWMWRSEGGYKDMDAQPILLCNSLALSTLKRVARSVLASLEDGSHCVDHYG